MILLQIPKTLLTIPNNNNDIIANIESTTDY